MAIDTQKPASRRHILTAGLGALGGLVASALGRPAAVRAAANGNVQLATGVGNTDNDAANETRVNATSAAITAFSAVSGTGTGLNGLSTDTTPTDFSVPFTSLAHSHKSGVIGTTGDITEIDPNNPNGPGHMPINTDEVGVFGFSNVSVNSNGVWGDSFEGTGVVGTGGTGVWGLGFWGVYAQADGSPGSAALVTKGKISFGGRSGRSYVISNHTYRDVPIAGMTSSSAVIATLQTNRPGIYVQAVVSYAGKFRLYLNKKHTGSTYFSYLVIN
jgi:hypothetical protein